MYKWNQLTTSCFLICGGLFDELAFSPCFAGFEKPSAIQQRAIIPMTQGRDVIAQSQSGTGKTAMLAIASLQLIDTTMREIQVFLFA